MSLVVLGLAYLAITRGGETDFTQAPQLGSIDYKGLVDPTRYKEITLFGT